VFQKFNGNYIGLIFDCVKKPHTTQKDFLPIARCLLPIAYCLLPITHCLPTQVSSKIKADSYITDNS
jgi:hypothetical protein